MKSNQMDFLTGNRKKLPDTQWQLREVDLSIRELLIQELKIPPLISTIISNRNIDNPDDAKRYLFPDLANLYNPFLMKDMKEAVERIIYAIQRSEKIIIYGDYDADGITSVVILIHFLQKIHKNIQYYIPDRISEGYGLNRRALEILQSVGANLIVAVDCGISDHEQIHYAKKLGIDTVILDHHEISNTLPKAIAVVNPHRSDCRFPFKHLAAVGIAFNYLIALRGALRKEGFWAESDVPNLKEYLDLVALGTIGDVVPLVDENRIFAKFGLELITEGRRTGIAALKSIAGIEGQHVDSTKASFSLIPRINAAGRIGSANDAVELLLSGNKIHAYEQARILDSFNRKRQDIERTIYEGLISRINGSGETEKEGTTPIVFYSKDWHPGVLGIVASRLVDRFGKPAILIGLKDGIGKGSGRSTDFINIYEQLKSCESLLITYGGHRYAAGITIKEENIEEFSKYLSTAIREQTANRKFTAMTTIDAQCTLKDITRDLVDQMDQLAPFGNQNPEPVLCVRNVSVESPSIVGKNHLRMQVRDDHIEHDSIWFSKGQYISDLSKAVLDIVFTPQMHYWNGRTGIQLKMKDVAIRANV